MVIREPSSIYIEQTSPLLSIAIWRVVIDFTPCRFNFGINDDIEFILNFLSTIGSHIVPPTRTHFSRLMRGLTESKCKPN